MFTIWKPVRISNKELKINLSQKTSCIRHYRVHAHDTYYNMRDVATVAKN